MFKIKTQQQQNVASCHIRDKNRQDEGVKGTVLERVIKTRIMS